jgi:hypothetical protein
VECKSGALVFQSPATLKSRCAMEFLNPLNIFTLGIYSMLGVAAMIAVYFVFYGARCAHSWMKRQPMPTDRVWAYVVTAGILGLCVGSFAQGLAAIHAECAAYGQTFSSCFLPTYRPVATPSTTDWQARSIASQPGSSAKHSVVDDQQDGDYPHLNPTPSAASYDLHRAVVHQPSSPRCE